VVNDDPGHALGHARIVWTTGDGDVNRLEF